MKYILIYLYEQWYFSINPITNLITESRNRTGKRPRLSDPSPRPELAEREFGGRRRVRRHGGHSDSDGRDAILGGRGQHGKEEGGEGKGVGLLAHLGARGQGV